MVGVMLLVLRVRPFPIEAVGDRFETDGDEGHGEAETDPNFSDEIQQVRRPRWKASWIHGSQGSPRQKNSHLKLVHDENFFQKKLLFLIFSPIIQKLAKFSCLNCSGFEYLLTARRWIDSWHFAEYYFSLLSNTSSHKNISFEAFYMCELKKTPEFLTCWLLLCWKKTLYPSSSWLYYRKIRSSNGCLGELDRDDCVFYFTQGKKLHIKI